MPYLKIYATGRNVATRNSKRTNKNDQTPHEFAHKAEDTGKLVWITKSNSLRRTAKEKEMTRKDIEDKIENVVDELKKT